MRFAGKTRAAERQRIITILEGLRDGEWYDWGDPQDYLHSPEYWQGISEGIEAGVKAAIQAILKLEEE